MEGEAGTGQTWKKPMGNAEEPALCPGGNEEHLEVYSEEGHGQTSVQEDLLVPGWSEF